MNNKKNLKIENIETIENSIENNSKSFIEMFEEEVEQNSVNNVSSVAAIFGRTSFVPQKSLRRFL
jgi:hypothetical protein